MIQKYTQPLLAVLLWQSCMLPSPRLRRSRHRFGQVQASPALCPCETRRPCGVKHAVSYGARADTRSLSCSRSERHLLRSVPSANIIPDCIHIFKPKRPLHFPAKSGYPASTGSNGSPRPFRSWLDERGPARPETAGSIHCAPRPPYPWRICGAEPPQNVSTSARPTRISTLTPSKCSRRHQHTTTTTPTYSVLK